MTTTRILGAMRSYNDLVVGTAEYYGQFLSLARARIVALGIPYATVDQVCGFPERYTATLLSGKKACSVYSFFTLARALALLPAFHHDDEELAQLKARSDWLAMQRTGPRFRQVGGAVKFHNDTEFYRRIGRKGALAWNAKRAKRKRAASIAARARWSKKNDS